MERPNIDRLTQQALDHVWFALTDPAQVREDGPGILVSAKGLEITTADGKTWLDMMGTQTRANSLGFGQDEIAKAVYDQLVRLHYAGCFAQAADVTVEFAAKLAELAPGRLTTTLFAGSGSGGYRIETGVLHSFLNMVDHKMRVQQAVNHPRVHCQGRETVVDRRIPETVRNRMARAGHQIQTVAEEPGGWPFGRVCAVAWDARRKVLSGGAGPNWNTGIAGL